MTPKLSRQYRNTEQCQAYTPYSSKRRSAFLYTAQCAWYSPFVFTVAAIAVSCVLLSDSAKSQNYEAVPNYAQPNQPAPKPPNSKDSGWSCATSNTAERTVRLCSPLILDPNSTDSVRILALMRRARAWVIQEEYEAAENDYGQIINIDPKHAAAVSERAKLFDKVGKHTAALEDYDRLIQMGNKNTYCKRGYAKLRLKNHQSALKDFDRGLVIEADNPDCLVGRGDVYADMRQLDKALKEYNAAIATNKHFTAAYFRRGELHKKLGKTQLAIADYAKILKLEFFNIEAAQELHSLGLLTLEQFEH